MTDLSSIGNSWTPYGLNRDPYFQEALEPLSGGAYPIELFVGRGDEVRLLARQVISAPTSRALVEGPRGIGKTTMVNKLKAVLAAGGVLTHAKPVRVTSEMTHLEFAADVLRKLLQIRATVNENWQGPDRKPESDADVAFWRRVQRLVEGEDLTNGGASAVGIGVTVNRTRIAAEYRTSALFDELAQAFRLLSTLAGGNTGNGGVLVHVNNLENLTRADAMAATTLMANLRDYFLIERSHWIFVGASGISHTVFGDPAVQSTIPLVTRLEPLTANQVVELLERRYRYLAVREDLVPPISSDAVRALYERYTGNLRGFLRLLSMAVQRYPFGDTVHSLSAQDILQSVATEYRRDLVKSIGAADAELLERTVVLVRGPRLRNADVVRATSLSVPAAKSLLDRLANAGILSADERIGKSFYHRLSGDAQTAFRM